MTLKDDTNTGIVQIPPRVILYGTPKIGKSTFCSQAPGNIFLDIEGGTKNLNVTRILKEKMPTFPDFLAYLDKLLIEEHDFKALTIDTADYLERLMMQKAAEEHGESDFGKIGYGKGYPTLVNMWKYVCDKLDEIRDQRGMLIVLIVHEKLAKIKEPNIEQYEKWSLDMTEQGVSVIKAWADIIMFAREEVFTEKTKDKRVRATKGDRMLYTHNTPGHLAGNRYNLPQEIPFTWNDFINAFNQSTKETE